MNFVIEEIGKSADNLIDLKEKIVQYFMELQADEIIVDIEDNLVFCNVSWGDFSKSHYYDIEENEND